MDNILKKLDEDLQLVQSFYDIHVLKSKYLGNTSILKKKWKDLKNVPVNQRHILGIKLNEAKEYIERSFIQKEKKIELNIIEERLKKEYIDMSLPGYYQPYGSIHLLTQLENKITSLLRSLGFSTVDGPELEDSYHNFDALNIPEYHPARDMQDTFWINENLLLRSHTTTVQIRALEFNKDKKLPIKIISLGRVYRNETIDSNHLACFHQYEGLYIGQGIKISHLKGIMEYLFQSIYGDRKIRFKPKYYPYTEPSIGIDIQCQYCSQGCKYCQNGWNTIAGAGMVHPNILKNMGYDIKDINGIAFGLGISRMVSQFYGLNMRQLYGMNLQIFKVIKWNT